MITWDVASIFNALGGVKGVVTLCAEVAPLDIPPRPDTVAVWKSRNKLPAEWAPVVVAGLLARKYTGTLFRTVAAPDQISPSLELSEVGL